METVTHYLPGILLAFGATGLGLMSPGPNVLAIMGTSMALGRRQGLALAAGVSAGSFLWAMATAVGLSSLLAAYAGALVVIKVVGGAYLLWLAFKAFRSASRRHDIETSILHGAGTTRLFRFWLRGLTVQMTNPKAALTWIAVMSLGLAVDSPVWVATAIVLGTSAMSLAAHGIYALAFSTAPMIRLYGRARRWIQAGLGLFFAYAGIRLLASRT